MLRKLTIKRQRKITIMEGEQEARMNQNKRLLFREAKLNETEKNSYMQKYTGKDNNKFIIPSRSTVTPV